MTMASMSRIRKTSIKALPTVLVLAASAGCAARGVPPPGPRAAGVEPVTVKRMLVKAPVLSWAEQELTGRCMRKNGFAYEVDAPPGTSEDMETLPSLGGFGTPLTVETARDGYPEVNAADPVTKDAEPGGTRRGFDRTLDDEHARQVHIEIPGLAVGASTRGCVAEARRRLYGSVRNYLMVEYLAQGVRQFGSRALDDPAVRRSLETYETCMRGRGYAAANPGQARRIATRRSEGAAAEVQMAISDARCQEEAGVYAALDAAVWRAAAPWLETTKAAFTSTAEVRSRAMGEAADLQREASRG